MDVHPHKAPSRRAFLLTLALCLLVSFVLAAPAHTQAQALVDSFWTAPALTMVGRGWTAQGVTLVPDDALILAPSATPLSCTASDIDGGTAAFDATSGLCAGHDPYPARAYNGRNYYNGGRFLYGAILSPRLDSAPFDQAVLSWVAQTPPGAWLQAHLRVRVEDPATGASTWTPWAALPVWSSEEGSVRRHAVNMAAGDGAVEVRTDTLVVRHGRVAGGFQVAVTLFTAAKPVARNTPRLRRISLALSRAGAAGAAGTDPPLSTQAAWGHELPVPPRSQMLASYHGLGYGGGGEVWCSPTSTSMILAYWARMLKRPDLDTDVPAAARGVYDWTYEGTGNWPFSVAFAPGALPGAPIPSTDGHLLVLRGFDASGNPIVNDPAGAGDGEVRRVYPRAAFERAWLGGSGGTAYVIYPQGWPVPPGF